MVYNMVYNSIYIYTYLVKVYIAIENGPVEIVDLPINSMAIFHSYVKNLPEGRYDIGWTKIDCAKPTGCHFNGKTIGFSMVFHIDVSFYPRVIL